MHDPTTTTGIDSKILSRVRALLAKAESTTFPEEAEALSAKAAELMARHAIDRALVDGAPRQGGPAPTGRAVVIDDPYASAKVSLLAAVARSSRCQVVWEQHRRTATVFGWPSDIDTVEVLFTSLLLQGGRGMHAASAHADPRSVKSFRRAFLLGYAGRIGQRLQEATERAEAEAVQEHGSSLLPVLAARHDEVARAFRAAYPRLRSQRPTFSDGRGFAAGRAAADHADLGQGRLRA